jgi:hypothetical protein
MNAYERRKQLRVLYQRNRNKERREISSISRHHVELKYREAFKLVFGIEPKITKPISSKVLLKHTEELFAEAHERELCLEELQDE